MPSLNVGDRVKVKTQSSSPFHSQIGTVVRTRINGLAVTYEVSFDQYQTLLSPGNRFFEYDLEPLSSS